MVKKIKTDKTEFLKLLEVEPQYEHDGCVPNVDGWREKREEWEESVKKAFYNDVLQVYEEDEFFLEEISELKDEVKELKKLLNTHIHRWKGLFGVRVNGNKA